MAKNPALKTEYNFDLREEIFADDIRRKKKKKKLPGWQHKPKR
jgi:hypothetical protein